MQSQQLQLCLKAQQHRRGWGGHIPRITSGTLGTPTDGEKIKGRACLEEITSELCLSRTRPGEEGAMGVLHGEVMLGKARVIECILYLDNKVTQ